MKLNRNPLDMPSLADVRDGLRVKADNWQSPLGAADLRRWADAIDAYLSAICVVDDSNLPPWKCFHCGEVFTTVGAAADHFGKVDGVLPGCVIDRVAVEAGGTPERGRGLLIALREAEADVESWRRAAEESDNDAGNEAGARFQDRRHIVDACRPGWSVERMVELVHASVAEHGGLAAYCDKWPCAALKGRRHAFTAPDSQQVERGADVTACILCGEPESDETQHLSARDAASGYGYVDFRKSRTWLVVRKREQYPFEVTAFHRYDEAAVFFDRAQTQWSDTYFCTVVAGPGEPLSVPNSWLFKSPEPSPVPPEKLLTLRWCPKHLAEIYACMDCRFDGDDEPSQVPQQPEPRHRRPVRVYVASRASVPERPVMWKRLRAEGWAITSTWIDEAGPGETADMCELWKRLTREIAAADGLVLYVEPNDFPLKGALVEAGIAIGMGKPVVVVLGGGLRLEPGSLRPLGSWAQHPLVEFKALDEARDYIAFRRANPEPSLAQALPQWRAIPGEWKDGRWLLLMAPDWCDRPFVGRWCEQVAAWETDMGTMEDGPARVADEASGPTLCMPLPQPGESR